MSDLLFEPRREVACFMSDPPWPERGAGKSKRGADAHYDVEKVRVIPDIMRKGMAELGVCAAANAHHWMWVTDNYLSGGLWCLAQLGFRYVRTAVWVKAAEPVATVKRLAQQIMEAVAVGEHGKLLSTPHLLDRIGERSSQAMHAIKPQIGIGQYLRGSHELVLLGVRGKGLDPSVRTEDRGVPSVIYGRRTKHSKKPDSAFSMVERVSRGPRVELFARSNRPGWESWGNEV
jgi:N6-adenosine-specific RNA methylase IME4